MSESENRRLWHIAFFIIAALTVIRIAVLVSGGGTNLQALINAQRAGKLKSGRLSLVVSSKAEAYALNDDVIVFQTKNRGRKTENPVSDHRSSVEGQSFITANRENTVIETIKRAEDGNGIIVRLYESQRQRGAFVLTTAFDLKAAWRTNLLEENQEEIAVKDNQLHYQIRPYQILTLRLIER